MSTDEQTQGSESKVEEIEILYSELIPILVDSQGGEQPSDPDSRAFLESQNCTVMDKGSNLFYRVTFGAGWTKVRSGENLMDYRDPSGVVKFTTFKIRPRVANIIIP